MFLNMQKKIGWKTTGLEINPETANFGRQKRGLNIFQKTINEFKTKEQFDVITMFDVLEHLENPKAAVLKAKKLLKKVVCYSFMSLIGIVHKDF